MSHVPTCWTNAAGRIDSGSAPAGEAAGAGVERGTAGVGVETETAVGSISTPGSVRVRSCADSAGGVVIEHLLALPQRTPENSRSNPQWSQIPTLTALPSFRHLRGTGVAHS